MERSDFYCSLSKLPRERLSIPLRQWLISWDSALLATLSVIRLRLALLSDFPVHLLLMFMTPPRAFQIVVTPK